MLHPTRGKNKFFLSVLKSPTQVSFDGVINLEPNISCLGLFKREKINIAAKKRIFKPDVLNVS